jgi:hypothetical protein
MRIVSGKAAFLETERQVDDDARAAPRIAIDLAVAPHALRPFLDAFQPEMLAVIAAYWYPFHFDFRGDVIRARLAHFREVPLHAYYWSTELTAVSEILRKMTFFAPGGALLAVPRFRMPSAAWRGVWSVCALLLVTCLAFGIELGQVALPDKVVDSGDPMLQVLGAVAGWFAAVAVLHRR